MLKKTKKILIVEDEQSMLRALVDKFTREGLEVIEAKNGEEGLELTLKEHPDLILLDIVMPKMDGMTMLRKLKEKGWNKDAEVVLLTNLSCKKNVADAVECGVYDYLVKSDWKIADVVQKVKERLGV